MNPFFTVLFPLLLICVCLGDRKLLSRQSKRVRFVYFSLIAASFALYLSMRYRINVPMPTKFFITYVSPAVETVLGLK